VVCRSQGNANSISSDGVPLELVNLDFCGVSAPTGLTDLCKTSLVRIVCNPRMLALSCVDQICVNSVFGVVHTLSTKSDKKKGVEH